MLRVGFQKLVPKIDDQNIICCSPFLLGWLAFFLGEKKQQAKNRVSWVYTPKEVLISIPMGGSYTTIHVLLYCAEEAIHSFSLGRRLVVTFLAVLL